jgi:PucR family transcriptional regulator, purine catabolism regulatory protein
VVLTTGLALVDHSPVEYVTCLSRAGVAAIGFAVGLGHDAVPAGLLAAAEGVGLAVFEVPYRTPFVAITRVVAEAVIGERFESGMRAVDVHERLARRLLSGDGLDGLIRTLAASVRAPCALIEFHGQTLAASPTDEEWPLDEIRRHRTETAPWSLPGLEAFPIIVDGEVVATLCTRSDPPDVVILRSAATLLGLELARRAAVLTGRRLLLGQVLEDILDDVLSDEEATRRLRRFGVDTKLEHFAVAAAVPGREDRLQHTLWVIQSLTGSSGDPVNTALVDGRLMVLGRRPADRQRIASLTHERLRRLAPNASVGSGDEYPGVSGLRRTMLEAVSAVGRGPGLHTEVSLSIADTLRLDRSSHSVARVLLEPLMADTDSGLLETLVTYFAYDCRPGPTAEALSLHRNGLAYRLERIAEQTGRDLSNMEDRVELMLAARTLGYL